MKMLDFEKNQAGGGLGNVSVADQLHKLETKSRVKNHSDNLKFFRRAFGFTLVLTFGVVYLQGAGVFQLSNGIIYSLCCATVGQLAGLFVLVLRQK